MLEDAVLNGEFNAISLSGESLFYYIESKPTHGTVTMTDESTGAFTYTPEANYFGSELFSFRVDGQCRSSNVAWVSVNVTGGVDPTTAIDVSYTVLENGSITIFLEGIDPDVVLADQLTYAIVSQPGLGSLVVDGTIPRKYTYTPSADTIGEDSFTFTAADGNSISAAATVSISIKPELVLSECEVLTAAVSGRDTFVPIQMAVTTSMDISRLSDAFITLTGPPGSGKAIVIQSAIRTTTYPFIIENNVDTNVNPLVAGQWTFGGLYVKKTTETTYQLLADNIAPTCTNTLTVIANTRPIAEAATYDVVVRSLKEGLLVASDPEGDSVTYQIVADAMKGSVELLDANTGAFRYSASDTLVPGETTDVFTFVANDGLVDSNIAQVSINLLSAPGHMAAYDDYAKYQRNEAYIGQLSAIDVDSHPLEYKKVVDPDEGSLSINSVSGEFIYRPKLDSKTTVSFQFRVNDGISDSNVATVELSSGNPRPIAYDSKITVVENVANTNALRAFDADGDALTYRQVISPAHGSLTLDATTGGYTYLPAANYIGDDFFKFVVNDGQWDSNEATIIIHVIDTPCGTGGVYAGLDSDGDGYINFVETALGTDPNDATVSPQDISTVDFITLFGDDDDADTYLDYVELWLGSNGADSESVPEVYFEGCFAPTSDGIKPRLVGLNIANPSLDISQGETSVSLAFSLLDNASGIRRIRVSLRSPSGVFMTASHAFESKPLVVVGQLALADFNTFSEQGVWQVSGVTVYDVAGNRLNLVTNDLSEVGMPTTITVTNVGEDAVAPTLVDFQITSPDVLPDGLQGDTMRMQLTVADTISGVISARVDFISPSGTIVSASQTLASASNLATVNLETPVLSRYLEAGIWTVFNVLLVDVAGNSTQAVTELTSSNNNLLVTNPDSDGVAPMLEILTVVTNTVYPANGDAIMRFGLTLSDNAGLGKIQLAMEGPSGQVKTFWAQFSTTHPVNAQVQVESETLSNLTESGTWSISFIEITDDAGNTVFYDSVDLGNSGYRLDVEVAY